MLVDFRTLLKEAKQVDASNLQKINVAILGDHATQFFSRALTSQLLLTGFDVRVFENDYNQIDNAIIGADKRLYNLQPDIVIFFENAFALNDKFQGISSDSEKNQFAGSKFSQIETRCLRLRENGLKSKIVILSFELFDDDVFGNLSTNLQSSFYYQVFQLNAKLMAIAQTQPGVFFFDINKYILSSHVPVHDWPQYVNADVPYTLDFQAHLSHHISQFISTLFGRFKKCLIVDLDNTLWGGIIGDDGLENIQIGSLGIGKAFTRLQKWMKALKERGIILAVCSKNTESIAQEPFEKHPEMTLRLDDFAVFRANWENKADNIRVVQEILNIGFDSMVFVDDNPAEREIIRQRFPDITVPELPEDPVLYLPFLQSLNLFDTPTYSKDDQKRTSQYQEESKRRVLFDTVSNIDDYLKSLEMLGVVDYFKPEDVTRITQLIQRSNQFNLRTIRYSENDIIEIIHSKESVGYSVKLKDKFGDYGLISVVILRKLADDEFFIDTWVMSCRVLNRGVEAILLNRILHDLKDRGVKWLQAEYIRTKKNELVRNLLDGYQFQLTEDLTTKKTYSLAVDQFSFISNFIN